MSIGSLPDVFLTLIAYDLIKDFEKLEFCLKNIYFCCVDIAFEFEKTVI